MVNPGEEPLQAARREFNEETGLTPEGPFLSLGTIRQKGGKVVHAWGCEGDADPAGIASNLTRLEWPRGSGRWLTFPEVDRCAWFDADLARAKMNPAQAELVDRLDAALARNLEERTWPNRKSDSGEEPGRHAGVDPPHG